MFLLHLSATALACGGFFCQQKDVDQAGENIVFAQTGSDMVVHVQITYEGTADDFSWIVPVPRQPTLFLSHEQLFQQLELQLRPVFQVVWTDDGFCNQDTGGIWWSDTGAVPDAGSGGGVDIVATGVVGPYDTVTLQADSAAALLSWLGTNNYDVPPDYDQVVAPYIAGQAYFVALKLRAGKNVGDLRPLAMRYTGDTPMIPLVLTSIAATPDMRLRAHVFGPHRAVPENYLHVQINERAIDWTTNGANYDNTVSRAADEAGGRAFATDMADRVAQTKLPGSLWAPGRYDTAALATETDPAAFLDAVRGQGLPRDDTMLSVLGAVMPMPQALVDQGVDPTSFYNCLSCFPESSQLVFDSVAAAAVIESDIVAPLRDAETLFDLPWVSRLTSSMSPDEMTNDPHFVFNPDMGPVDRVHTAEIFRHCADSDGVRDEAPLTVTLEDGSMYYVPGADRMLAFAEGQAAARVIEETGSSGQPIPLDIPVDLDPAEPSEEDPGAPDKSTAAGGCGCAPSPAPLGVLPWLALLPLLLRRH